REEEAKESQKINEKITEVGPRRKYQAILSAYREKNFNQTAIEQALSGNFEMRVEDYFRAPTNQPDSVIKLVGLKGEKLAGEWVERSDSDGKFVRYRQHYRLKTHADSPMCINIKAEKMAQ